MIVRTDAGVTAAAWSMDVMDGGHKAGLVAMDCCIMDDGQARLFGVL